MKTITSFSASAVSQDRLSGILADYLALEQARVMRRLLVVRCGLMACAAAVGGAFLHGMSPFARWVPVGLLLNPPIWAWFAELRLARRLARRLDDVDGVVHDALTPGPPRS